MRKQQSTLNDRAMAAAENSGRRVSAAIYLHIQARVQSLQRMAKRLQRDKANHGSLHLPTWLDDASEYLQDQTGHINIQVIGTDGERLASTPATVTQNSDLLLTALGAQNKGKDVTNPTLAASSIAIDHVVEQKYQSQLDIVLTNGDESITHHQDSLLR